LVELAARRRRRTFPLSTRDERTPPPVSPALLLDGGQLGELVLRRRRSTVTIQNWTVEY